MTLALFGSRQDFAIGFELLADQDSGEQRPERAGSWGAFQLWVGGRNLTEAVTATEDSVQQAECPLLPLVAWIARNWDLMFHESRLPRASYATSARWHSRSIESMWADDKLLDERLDWWHRHGLGAALPDYRIPDVHIRRMGDDVELSWDDAEWRTVPTGIVLSEGTGAALVPAALVAERLYDWSRAIAVGCRGRCDANVLAELDDQLGGLRSQTRAVSRLQIAAGLQSLERAARRLISLAGVQATGLQHVLASMLGAQDGAASPCLVAPLTVPVLLFRSSAPSLTEADIDQLLGLVPRSVEEVPVEFPPRKPTPCPLEPRDATQSGYDLALDFREWLGLSETEPLLDAQDLEKVLFPKLGLCVRDVALTDVRTEGASVYVEGHRPTIAINAAGRFSATRWGRRMTLAHELCHLLHDGGSAGGVGVVSNPWAPYLMERRANAFAAHFLAPPAALHALLGESSATWTAEDLGDVMKKLGIGAHTLVRQLQNMRWIGEPEADAWLGELAGEV